MDEFTEMIDAIDASLTPYERCELGAPFGLTGEAFREAYLRDPGKFWDHALEEERKKKATAKKAVAKKRAPAKRARAAPVSPPGDFDWGDFRKGLA